MTAPAEPPAPGPRCPICARPTQTRWRPFCSRRCADVDLNRWLSGVYAVPVREEEDEDGDMPPPPAAGPARGDAADEPPEAPKVIDFPRDRRRRR